MKIGDAQPERGALSAACDQQVREALRIGLAALSGLYAILAVAHFLLLPRPAKMPMAAVAGGSAVLLGLLRWLLGRWPVRPGWGHPGPH